MARDGVHRVPLQQIADEAEVSKGLLLYHFNTKDAMVLEAMNWVLEATAARIRLRLQEAEDPGLHLATLLDAIWIGPEANRDFFRFYLDGVEFGARTPGFEEFGERGREIIEGLYSDVISAGRQGGVFHVADAAVAALQMRAVIEGFFLQWLQTTDWRSNHGHFKELCLASLNRVLGAASPAATP